MGADAHRLGRRRVLVEDGIDRERVADARDEAPARWMIWPIASIAMKTAKID
jgi:hypothetical protein